MIISNAGICFYHGLSKAQESCCMLPANLKDLQLLDEHTTSSCDFFTSSSMPKSYAIAIPLFMYVCDGLLAFQINNSIFFNIEFKTRHKLEIRVLNMCERSCCHPQADDSHGQPTFFANSFLHTQG